MSRSVEIYSIARDEWNDGPNLNKSRFLQTSCSLGDKAYVFGGETDSLESLDVAALMRGEQVEWQLLHIDLATCLSPQDVTFAVPINATNIVLFGTGDQDYNSKLLNQQIKNGYAESYCYNTQKDKLTKHKV